MKVELMAESFHLLNRDNKRVQITQDGFISTRPSLCKRLTLLESIFFQLKTACPLGSCTLLTHTLPGRYNWP